MDEKIGIWRVFHNTDELLTVEVAEKLEARRER
jgi:hypothetical protein